MTAAPYTPLMAYRQFVPWRVEHRNGKPTKVPLDPTGHHPASVTDSANYLDYATAAAVANSVPGVEGVGFVLTDTDPFFLFDLDKCRTGTQWSDVASEAARLFAGALAEVSFSGNGMHIIGSYRSMPAHRKKNVPLGLELYHTERFIALGDMATAVGSAAFNCDALLPGVIAEYFNAPTKLVEDEWTDTPCEGWGGPADDEALVALAHQSKPPLAAVAFGAVKASFTDLWGGDFDALAEAFPSDNHGGFDRSSADLSLASKLAFYTGHDCERIVRLMRASGLARDKFDREDYMMGTVLRATEDRSQFYEARRRELPAVDADAVERVRQEIESKAGDVSCMHDILRQVISLPDPLMREGMSQLYKQRLREGKLYNARVGKEIDAVVSPPSMSGATVGEGADIPGNEKMSPVMWQHTKGANLRPLGTQENFDIMLSAYGVAVVFDEVLKEVRIKHPGQQDGVLKDEAAFAFITSLANLNHYPKGDLDIMLAGHGHRRTINPVTDWLLSAPWDGFDRFPHLLNAFTFDAAEDVDLAALLLRKWFRAAVAIGTGRARKMEYVLTLVDERGGAGKTRFFSGLGPEELVKDSLVLDTTNKDNIKTATSCWLAELGELDGTFRKSDQAKLKAFLSAHVDEIRLPYGKTYNKYPRRTAFFASVNSTSFLIDGSSNRRFWPIRVAKVDHEHGIEVQQLWAQMYFEVQSGATWHLDDDETVRVAEHNEAFRTHSRIDDLLSAVAGPGDRHLSVTECLSMCGHHGATKADLNEAAAWLRRKGCAERKRSGKRGFMVEIVPPTAHVFAPVAVS